MRLLCGHKTEASQIHQSHGCIEGQPKLLASWNVAHLVVTQQLLHYKLSNLDCLCPDELIASYKKGTVPTKNFTEEEFEEVKDLLLGLPDVLQEDFEAGIFENFSAYPTSTGLVLDRIETAIVFNNYHEGIHYGIIRAIKKFL